MSETNNNKLTKVLVTIFQPISKILIKNEIPIQRVVEILKRSLVETATQNAKVTDSYVSLKTGVHRKDVRRFRAAESSPATKKLPTSPIALLLTKWTQTEIFCASDGKPRALSRGEFDELVRHSKVDLPPATVLSELLAQTLVRQDDTGQLQLLSATYLPKTDAAALSAFEATITDHLRVAVDNTLTNDTDTKAFDRVLRYSHLSQSSVEQLENYARERGQTYLEELNELAHELQKRDDLDGETHRARFVSGVYIAPSLPTHNRTKT